MEMWIVDQFANPPPESQNTAFFKSSKLQGLHSKTHFSKTTEGETEPPKDYSRKISLNIY